MKKALQLFFLAFLLLGFNASFAKGIDVNKLRQKIQHRLDSLQKANNFPGCTLTVILSNGKKLMFATGYADTNTKVPMSTHSRLMSGSIGKTFFEAPAMVLVEKGTIGLDHKISEYIGKEAWFNKIPNANTITIRMLMNHTSGIEEYYELGDFMEKLKNDKSKVWTPEEILSYVFDRKPLFEAGQGWGYADTNYILLGLIIEKVTGQKMYDLADKYALKPYHLKLTEPSTKLIYNDIAVGYSSDKSPFPFHGGIVENGQMVMNTQFEWTGGGFVTNSGDLATWAKDYYNYKFISPASRHEMQTGVAAKTGKGHLYGLGMQIRPSDWGFGYGHSGWFPGYVSDCEYFPQPGISMAIQFNTDDFKLLKTPTHTYITDILKLIEQS